MKLKKIHSSNVNFNVKEEEVKEKLGPLNVYFHISKNERNLSKKLGNRSRQSIQSEYRDSVFRQSGGNPNLQKQSYGMDSPTLAHNLEIATLVNHSKDVFAHDNIEHEINKSQKFQPKFLNRILTPLREKRTFKSKPRKISIADHKNGLQEGNKSG